MAIKKRIYPAIPVRGFVIFPKTIFHFDVAREKSIAAIEKAIDSDGLIFLVSQKDETIENPHLDDIYKMGTVSKIRQLVKLPDGGIRILVEGVERGEWTDLIVDDYYEAVVREKPSTTRNLSPEEYSAFLSQIHYLINDYIESSPKLAQENFLKNLPETEPQILTDVVANNLLRQNEDKQELLETTNVKKRLEKLISMLTTEVKILEIENQISARVKVQMDDNNRDYYLREQLRAIKAELGDDGMSEAEEIRAKLNSLNLPQEVRKKAFKELSYFERLQPSSPESATTRHYLELICDMPWNVYSTLNTDLSLARKILDKDHSGMEKVKERVIEQLAVINRTNKPSGTILCLLGAPGVGKTSVAKSIAEATGRKYERISLGGMRDEAELRGHRKTYVGAMPGRIVNAIKNAGTENPLILLDEIDKLGSDYKGDPTSAMLEILDDKQNFSFRDNFLEVGLDLSKVLFIATANSLDTIPSPLLDRMEIIELSSYTQNEKMQIAKEHLIKNQLEFHGLKKSSLRINDEVIEKIITCYTREAGVRKLERYIGKLCRKAVLSLSESGKKSFTVNLNNIEELLGPSVYTEDDFSPLDRIGVVNGLAWTSVGGCVLKCEAVALYGTGKLSLTGKLGDVMKESCQIALSFIRSISDSLSLEKDFYKKYDLHIHFPEGATPKDGPSAGITIATAIASALTKRKVRGNISMTGEITLNGEVLPIGGLKEKVLASFNNGIREIIIPIKNKKDLEEIPKSIREKITFHAVSDCREVLKLCLVENTGIQKNEVKAKERISLHEYS